MKRLLASLFTALAVGAAQPAPPPPTSPATTPLAAARAILAIPLNHSSWNDYIVLPKHNDGFLWTEFGEQIERWNRLAGSVPGAAKVDKKIIDGRYVYLSYRGRTLQAPVKESREDDTIEVHTLSRLVKSDWDIRFCVDSWHTSDLAFLALPPATWRTLEHQFGADAVRYRFIPLPEDLDAFWKAFDRISAEAAKRSYAD